MIFHFFIFIVFLAEIIIAFFMIFNLIKINNTIIEFNRFFYEAKPQIREIGELGKKISVQMIELANHTVEKIKDTLLDYAAKNVKGMLTGLLIWEAKRKLKKAYKTIF